MRLTSPLAGVVLLVLANGTSASPLVSTIRLLDDDARRLVGLGVERSETIRQLIGQLERTDLVVMISITPPPAWQWPRSEDYHASTRFLASTGSCRYVAVWIDARWRHVAVRRQVALLAHELQHALEVGLAPEVVSQKEMLELFVRIGRRQSALRFETDSALHVESRVYKELPALPQPRPAT